MKTISKVIEDENGEKYFIKMKESSVTFISANYIEIAYLLYAYDNADNSRILLSQGCETMSLIKDPYITLAKQAVEYYRFSSISKQIDEMNKVKAVEDFSNWDGCLK